MGTLNGTVISIADDITLEGNRAYFRVQCRLERNWLKLPGGVRRPIKSGMTLQAQLHVAERTLLQLLFDRMDNWLNPYWDSTGPNEPVNGSLSATAGNRS